MRRASIVERWQRSRRAAAGFTLLELIVVIAIIGILAAIAMPQLKNVPRRAAEAALKTDLKTFRESIDQYHADKGYYPASLETLIDEGYMRKIPVDPITKSAETWEVIHASLDAEEGAAETDLTPGDEPGIIDVRSGSDQLSLDGTPYSEW